MAYSAEPLLFELSTPGARGVDLPGCDVPQATMDAELTSALDSALPQIGPLDLVRHYTRLSHRNFSVDANFYPLGSCTMKYNPKINEVVAALPGFADLHPMQDARDCQGALALLYELQNCLAEISGLPSVSLQPCAGAHGEWTALKVISAYYQARGETRRRIVLAPDTAHGTNPASCAMCGVGVVTIRSTPQGLTDLDDLQAHLSDEVMAVMLTNPNTIGKFDRNIREIAERVHAAGAMLYLDGANMNAILGIARPADFGVDAMHFNTHKTFSTPHGCGGPGAGPIAVNKELAPYLPGPWVVRTDQRRDAASGDGPAQPADAAEYQWSQAGEQSIGRVRSFWGQFGVLIRAYAYIRACGGMGLRHVSQDAVLAANYVAARLKHAYPLPFGPGADRPMVDDPCAHEFITVPRAILDRGVTIIDIAKSLIDRGFHPPTVHFPIHDCLMIEPTETESKRTLDRFIDAMLDIADQSAKEIAPLKQAPVNQSVRRLDEVAAARKPVLRWMP